MEKTPHSLVEGMITSAYALGVHTSYIYIRGEFFYVARILENAIKEAYAAGLLGKNILGTDFSLDCHVHVGAGAYICGEETALLESLEGKRGNPRIKPPFPAVAGLYHLARARGSRELIRSPQFSQPEAAPLRRAWWPRTSGRSASQL